MITFGNSEIMTKEPVLWAASGTEWPCLHWCVVRKLLRTQSIDSGNYKLTIRRKTVLSSHELTTIRPSDTEIGHLLLLLPGFVLS